jgi:hypothetical protein
MPGRILKRLFSLILNTDDKERGRSLRTATRPPLQEAGETVNSYERTHVRCYRGL